MSPELLAELARQERLQNWIQELEKRISLERRSKVLKALREELEKCHEDGRIIDARITRLESEEESQAS
jgi:hypothetical protein